MYRRGPALGIETRRNGRTYFYRKTRVGGRVSSEYVGSGEVAGLYAALDRLQRDERQAEECQRRERHRAEQAEERAAWGLLAEGQQLAALAMLAAGYHRHKGTWRRRRHDPMGRNLSPSQQLIERLERQAAKAAGERRRAEERAGLPPLPAPDDDSKAAMLAILKRADRVDATPEDMAALRALLDKGRDIGFVAGPVRQALARELAEMPATGLGRELLTRDLDRRRRELGYDAAPALERPLIDLVLLCELRLGNIEQVYSVKWGTNGGGISSETARFWEQRLSAAQRRFLGAVETLARVRRVRVELARVLPDGSAEAVAVEGPGA